MFQKFTSLRDSLTKTRDAVFGRVVTLLGQSQVTPELWDELEALLVQADVGVNTTLELLDRLRRRAASEGITRADMLRVTLRNELRAMLGDSSPLDVGPGRPLTVVLVVGVNGSGKTTSIAKLAAFYKQQQRSVLLAAADTFRAAAGEQLDIWAGRVGVPIVGGQPGSDPGSVVFDAIQAAQARKADLLIADTAGRLHTQYNLMQELKKVRGVSAKAVPGSPHETLLVIDATNGQNALVQAEQFKDAVGVSGVILTKLDGTAKGGIVFAIAHELKLPMRFVGTGERVEDLAEFDADAFVAGLFDSNQYD
jgi:fused signal recognition particle receptor